MACSLSPASDDATVDDDSRLTDLKVLGCFGVNRRASDRRRANDSSSMEVYLGPGRAAWEGVGGGGGSCCQGSVEPTFRVDQSTPLPFPSSAFAGSSSDSSLSESSGTVKVLLSAAGCAEMCDCGATLNRFEPRKLDLSEDKAAVATAEKLSTEPLGVL